MVQILLVKSEYLSLVDIVKLQVYILTSFS